MWRFPELSSIFLRGTALFLWMGVIFFFSSLPGSEYPFDPPLSYYLERKGAHVVEYAILLFLTVRFFRVIFPKETVQRVLFLSAVFAVAYGASDELHQYFVPYRGAKISDILVDSLGILISCGGYFFCHTLLKKRKMASLRD